MKVYVREIQMKFYVCSSQYFPFANLYMSLTYNQYPVFFSLKRIETSCANVYAISGFQDTAAGAVRAEIHRRRRTIGQEFSLAGSTQCQCIIRAVEAPTSRYSHDSNDRIPREIKPPRGITRARSVHSHPGNACSG